MAKNGVATPPPPSSITIPRPANLTLPPRSSAADNSFLAGFAGLSPGPMTLVSSLFTNSDTPRSFSQLLASAMASPSAAAAAVNLGGASEDPVSVTPPGLSPSGLLNSIGLLSPVQSPFGMSHQQALAHVTAQAALAQPNNLNPAPAAYDLNPLADPHESDCSKKYSTNTEQQKQVVTSDSKICFEEPSDIFLPRCKSQPFIISPNKPEDDGYNWRKYGQKQVKGSDHPRSYYRCSHLSCPVKKKVERSLEGQITEIIYKGQHTHESPPKKPSKGGSLPAENIRSEANPTSQLRQTEVPRRSVEPEPAQLIYWEDQEPVQKSSSKSLPIDAKKLKSATEGSPDVNTDPTLKRRKTGAGSPEPTPSHNTVVEEKIVVQTKSEVDLLDDGFRWRKYGQKAVKGNIHPRSYYKCTTPGCSVRKHVERASADPKSVITTYEGKHNHEFPAGRGNSHNVPS